MSRRRELELAERIQQLRHVVNDDGDRSESHRQRVVALPLWRYEQNPEFDFAGCTQVYRDGRVKRIRPTGMS